MGACTSSPAYRTSGATSSPNTEMTIPSSASRPRHSKPGEASSPIRAGTTNKEKMLESGKSVVGWRKVQQVELSDEDEPKAKKVISITPYQRYGTLRTPSSSSHLPSSFLNAEEDDEEEADFSSYAIRPRQKKMQRRIATQMNLTTAFPSPGYNCLPFVMHHLPSLTRNIANGCWITYLILPRERQQEGRC